MGAILEAERVDVDAPPVLVLMRTVATGQPGCPYHATGSIEFWTSIVDPPLDCLHGSVIASGGVIATRVACFSDP